MRIKQLISGRVSSPRDDLPGGNARLVLDLITTCARRGLPLEVQKTSVWGVVWWEDFHEEESEGQSGVTSWLPGWTQRWGLELYWRGRDPVVLLWPSIAAGLVG